MGHKFENLKVSHKTKSIELDVVIDSFLNVNNCYVRYTVKDVFVSFKTVQNRNCLCISSFNIKGDIKKYIESLFNVKVSSSKDLLIELSDSSFESIQEIEKSFKEETKIFKGEIAKRAELMPTFYTMYDFFDMGDYVVNYERSIKLWRQPLPEENQNPVFVKGYDLWNKNIHNVEDWNADVKTVGCENGKFVKISDELAQKWIAIHSEVIAEKLIEENKKVEAEKIETEKENKRVADIFQKAKDENNRVVLYSEFLSDSQIPRKYRDEDSDMGSLITWANPDGSTSESFSHAY